MLGIFWLVESERFCEPLLEFKFNKLFNPPPVVLSETVRHIIDRKLTSFRATSILKAYTNYYLFACGGSKNVCRG